MPAIVRTAALLVPLLLVLLGATTTLATTDDSDGSPAPVTSAPSVIPARNEEAERPYDPAGVHADSHAGSTWFSSPTPAPSPSSTTPPGPAAPVSHFALVQSSGSGSNSQSPAAADAPAIDVLEIAHLGNEQSPRIAFEPMANADHWVIEHWQNPIADLQNLVANAHVDLHGGPARIDIMLLGRAQATRVSFKKDEVSPIGPTLVLKDGALHGLSRLMILEFENFDLSFAGKEWLPPGIELNKLSFDHTTIEAFQIGSLAKLSDVVIRHSTADRFPRHLLSLNTTLNTLILEDCTFLEPITLTTVEVAAIKAIPHLVMSNITAPVAKNDTCVEVVAVLDTLICVRSLTVKAVAPLVPSLDKKQSDSSHSPSQSPLDASAPKLRHSNDQLHAIVAVACLVGGIGIVVVFIAFKRRRNGEQPPPESQLTFTNQRDNFLNDESVRSSRCSSIRALEGGLLAQVDIGSDVVALDGRMGVNGLWRGEYQGTLVAAMRLNLTALSATTRSLESIVGSLIPLRHPSIVPFLGTSLLGLDEALVVVEHMANGSLRGVLHQRKVEITWDLAVKMSQQIASALAFVHAKHSIRVSPALTSRTVLCDEDLNCKLDVFELIESLRDHCLPDCAYGQGDISSRAPEVLRGERVTPASEVYALGVIFCELAVQGQVYEDILDQLGPTLGEIFIAKEVVSNRLRPEPPAETPDDFRDVIMACTAPDPCERPSTSEVLQWLEGWV